MTFFSSYILPMQSPLFIPRTGALGITRMPV